MLSIVYTTGGCLFIPVDNMVLLYIIPGQGLVLYDVVYYPLFRDRVLYFCLPRRLLCKHSLSSQEIAM